MALCAWSVGRRRNSVTSSCSSCNETRAAETPTSFQVHSGTQRASVPPPHAVDSFVVVGLARRWPHRVAPDRKGCASVPSSKQIMWHTSHVCGLSHLASLFSVNLIKHLGQVWILCAKLLLSSALSWRCGHCAPLLECGSLRLPSAWMRPRLLHTYGPDLSGLAKAVCVLRLAAPAIGCEDARVT